MLTAFQPEFIFINYRQMEGLKRKNDRKQIKEITAKALRTLRITERFKNMQDIILNKQQYRIVFQCSQGLSG